MAASSPLVRLRRLALPLALVVLCAAAAHGQTLSSAVLTASNTIMATLSNVTTSTDCRAAFTYLDTSNATKAASPFANCTVSGTTSVTLILASGVSYAAGDQLNIKVNQTTLNTTAGTPFVAAATPVAVRPILVSATLTSASTLVVKLPLSGNTVPTDFGTNMTICGGALQLLSAAGTAKSSPFTACALSGDIITLTLAGAYAAGDGVNVVAGQTILQYGTTAYARNAAATTIAPTLVSVTLASTSSIAVGASAPLALPANASAAICNSIFDVKQSNGTLLPAAFVSCSVGPVPTTVTAVFANGTSYAGGMTINLRANQTSLVAAPAGPVVIPLATALAISPTILSASLTTATTIVVALPVASATSGTFDCNSVFELRSAGAATATATPFTDCALSSNGLTVTLTLTAGKYKAGDTLNVKSTNTILSVAGTNYVPKAVSVLPTITTAYLVSSTVVSVSLPVPSALPAVYAAADCARSVIIAAANSTVAKPIASCALAAGASSLLVTLGSGATFASGDTVNVQPDQWTLRAGQTVTVGPTYVPSPAPIAIMPTFTSAVLTAATTIVVQLPAASALASGDCNSAFQLVGSGAGASPFASCALGASNTTLTLNLTASTEYTVGFRVSPKTTNTLLAVGNTSYAYLPVAINPTLLPSTTAVLVSPTSIVATLPFTSYLPSTANATHCNAAFELKSAAGTAKTAPFTACAVSGTTLTLTVAAGTYTAGDTLGVKANNTIFLGSSGPAYVPTTTAITITPTIVAAAISGTSTVFVTLSAPAALNTSACNSAFVVTGKANVFANCTLSADSLSVTLMLSTPSSVAGGDTINVVASQTALMAGTVAFLPAATLRTINDAVLLTAHLTSLTTLVAKLSVPSVAAASFASSCNNVFVVANSTGSAKSTATSSCVMTDSTTATLTIGSGTFVAGDTLNIKSGQTFLTALDAAGPAIPTAATVKTISPAITTAVATAYNTFLLPLPLQSDLGAGCTSSFTVASAGGTAKTVTGCALINNKTSLTVTISATGTGADAPFAAGDTITIVSGQAVLKATAAAGAYGPLTPVTVVPTVGTATVTSDKSVTVVLPGVTSTYPSPLTPAACNAAIGLYSSGSLKSIASCSVSGSTASTVTMSLTLASSYVGGDTINVVQTNTSVVMSVGTAIYGPLPVAATMQPTLVSAKAVSRRSIWVTLPAASTFVKSDAAVSTLDQSDCGNTITISSSRALNATSACNLNSTTSTILTITLDTNSYVAGDTIDISNAQGFLVAGSKSGPAYISRSALNIAPALVTSVVASAPDTIMVKLPFTAILNTGVSGAPNLASLTAAQCAAAVEIKSGTSTRALASTSPCTINSDVLTVKLNGTGSDVYSSGDNFNFKDTNTLIRDLSSKVAYQSMPVAAVISPMAVSAMAIAQDTFIITFPVSSTFGGSTTPTNPQCSGINSGVLLYPTGAGASAKTLATSACSMSGNTLTVKVASGSYFAAGDYVDVAASQTALVASTAGPAYVGTSVQGSTVQVGCGYLSAAKATAADTIVVTLPVSASINDASTDYTSGPSADQCRSMVEVLAGGVSSNPRTIASCSLASTALTLTLAAGNSFAAGDTVHIKSTNSLLRVSASSALGGGLFYQNSTATPIALAYFPSGAVLTKSAGSPTVLTILVTFPINVTIAKGSPLVAQTATLTGADCTNMFTLANVGTVDSLSCTQTTSNVITLVATLAAGAAGYTADSSSVTIGLQTSSNAQLLTGTGITGVPVVAPTSVVKIRPGFISSAVASLSGGGAYIVTVTFPYNPTTPSTCSNAVEVRMANGNAKSIASSGTSCSVASATVAITMASTEAFQPGDYVYIKEGTDQFAVSGASTIKYASTSMAVSPAYVTSVAAIATNKLMVVLPVDSNLNTSGTATSCANTISITASGGLAGAKSAGCSLTALESSRYLTITLAAGQALAATDTFDFKASQTAVTVGTTANGAPYAPKLSSLPTVPFGDYDNTVFTATVVNSTGIDISLPMVSSLSGSTCSGYLSFTNSLSPSACTVYQPAGQTGYYLSVNLSSTYVAGSTVTLNLASSTTLTAGVGTTQKYASVTNPITMKASIASAVLVSATSVMVTLPVGSVLSAPTTACSLGGVTTAALAGSTCHCQTGTVSGCSGTCPSNTATCSGSTAACTYGAPTCSSPAVPACNSGSPYCRTTTGPLTTCSATTGPTCTGGTVQTLTCTAGGTPPTSSKCLQSYVLDTAKCTGALKCGGTTLTCTGPTSTTLGSATTGLSGPCSAGNLYCISATSSSASSVSITSATICSASGSQGNDCNGGTYKCVTSSPTCSTSADPTCSGTDTLFCDGTADATFSTLCTAASPAAYYIPTDNTGTNACTTTSYDCNVFTTSASLCATNAVQNICTAQSAPADCSTTFSPAVGDARVLNTIAVGGCASPVTTSSVTTMSVTVSNYKPGDTINVNGATQAVGTVSTLYLKQGSLATGTAITNYIARLSALVISPSIEAAYITGAATIRVVLPVAAAVPRANFNSSCNSVFYLASTATGSAKSTSSFTSCWLDPTDLKTVYLTLTSASSYTSKDYVNIVAGQGILTSYAAGTNGRVAFAPRPLSLQIVPQIVAAIATSATTIVVQLPIPSYRASSSATGAWGCEADGSLGAPTIYVSTNSGTTKRAAATSACTLSSNGMVLTYTLTGTGTAGSAAAGAFTPGDKLYIDAAATLYGATDASLRYAAVANGITVYDMVPTAVAAGSAPAYTGNTQTIVKARAIDPRVVEVELPTVGTVTGTGCSYLSSSNGNPTACTLDSTSMLINVTLAADYAQGDDINVASGNTALTYAKATGTPPTTAGTAAFGSAASAPKIAGSIAAAQATATNIITVTLPAAASFFTSSLQADLPANDCATVLAVSDASGNAKSLLSSSNPCALSTSGSTTMTVKLAGTFAAGDTINLLSGQSILKGHTSGGTGTNYIPRRTPVVISPTILTAVAISAVTIRVTLPVSSSFFDASTPPLSLNSRSLSDGECGTIVEVKSSTSTKTLNGTACSISGSVLTVTLSSSTPYAPGDTINIKSGNMMLRAGTTSDGPLYTPSATAVTISIGYFVSAVATEPRTVYLTLPFPSAIFPSAGGSAIDPPTLNDCTSVISIGSPAYAIDSTSLCVFITSTLLKVTLASSGAVAAGDKADVGVTGAGSGAVMRAVATGTPTASSTPYLTGTLQTAGAITVGPTITSAAATSATTVSLTLALTGFIPGAAGGVLFNETQCSGMVAFTPAKALAPTDACRFRSGSSNLILDITLSGSGANGVFAGGDTVNISSSNLASSTYALYAGGSTTGPVFVPYSAGVTIAPNLVSAIAVDVNKVEVTLPAPSYYGTTAPSCDTIIAFGTTKAYPGSNSCVLDSAKTTLTVMFDGTTATDGFYAANDQVNVKSDNSVFKAGTTTAGPVYKASSNAVAVNPSIISAKATGPQTIVVALPTDSAFFSGSAADNTVGGISGTDCAQALAVASSALVTKSLKSCLVDSATPRVLTVTLADNETFAAGDTINVLPKNSASSSAATKPLKSGTGSSPVRAYKPRASPVKIAAGYILGSYAVGTSDIAIQLPVTSFVSGTDCSSAILVQSADAVPVTKSLATCSVDSSGTYLTVTLASTAAFASGDVVTIKSTNAVLYTGSDNTGALYAAVLGTNANNVLATIDWAYMVSPTTILVTMPAAVTLTGGVSKTSCDAVFNFTSAVGGSNVTSPIMECSLLDSSTVNVTLNSSALYTPGMAINIRKDQTTAKVGGSGGTNLVVFPLDTPITPTIFGSNATLVAPTTVAVPLPGASSLSSTTAADCAASMRITSVLGEDAASPFSGCSVGSDGTMLSLALASPSYAPGQSFNVKSTNSILRLGPAATGALYQPFTSQVPDLPILTSIFTAVLVDPSTVVVNLPAPAAVPANFTLDECLKSLAFLTSAGLAKNGTLLTSCTLSPNKLALTLSLAAPLSLAGGDRVNIKPGQAALRVAALDSGPSYVPKALAQVVTPAFFGSANLTAATSVVVKLPFPSALATGADCKTVVALLSTAGAVKNVSSCTLGADGVSLSVTLAAASYTAGDTVNSVPGQRALTLADGATPYVPSESGIRITPNIVSATLTNATIITVALPTASVLTNTAAADCNAAVVIASNGSAVASPLSACAVSADGLSLTLTAAATYKPMAGDTVDVAVSQTVLRAGSATGPAYVPRPAPALITVPSPPPSPPPSPAPSPPPSPPLSTANYSARGLATGPLSCNVLIGDLTVTTTSGNFTGMASYAGKDASYKGSCKDAVTGAVYTDDTVASTLPAGLTGLVLSPVTALASVWDLKSVADLANTNKDYLRLLGVPVNASAYGTAVQLLAYDYYVKGFVALETPAVAVLNVEGMVAANLLMYTKFFDGLNASVAGRDITAAQALAAGQYALAAVLEDSTAPINTTDPASILALLNVTYSVLTVNATSAAGRRLLQTAPAPFTQLQAQATALAAAAAGSNALVAAQQARLITAINAGTSISAAELTNIINEASKVIVAQSTVIATAATGLGSGAISPASFTSSYTGSALSTLVAQQQLAATPGSDVTAGPAPSPPSDDKKSNTGLIVGLVVGLVGGAIVITLIVVFIVMRRRKQNVAAAGQATA